MLMLLIKIQGQHKTIQITQYNSTKIKNTNTFLEHIS